MIDKRCKCILGCRMYGSPCGCRLAKVGANAGRETRPQFHDGHATDEAAEERTGIDFLHPRKKPPPPNNRRRNSMVAIGVAAVGVVYYWSCRSEVQAVIAEAEKANLEFFISICRRETKNQFYQI